MTEQLPNRLNSKVSQMSKKSRLKSTDTIMKCISLNYLKSVSKKLKRKKLTFFLLNRNLLHILLMRLMSLEKSWQRLKQWLTSVLERENLLSPNFTQDSTVKFGMIYIQMKEISRQYKERGLRTEKRTVRCFSMVSGIKSLKQTGLRHHNQWLSN